MARTPTSGHRNQLKYLRSCFKQENKCWAQILTSPQKLEEYFSKRIDSDKMVFSPRPTNAHLEVLRNPQTAEAIRLQQLYQSIRNPEMAIIAKRQFSAAKRNANFLSRLLGRHKSRLTSTVERLATKIARRRLVI